LISITVAVERYVLRGMLRTRRLVVESRRRLNERTVYLEWTTASRWPTRRSLAVMRRLLAWRRRSVAMCRTAGITFPYSRSLTV
jgi:hypothetical protein